MERPVEEKGAALSIPFAAERGEVFTRLRAELEEQGGVQLAAETSAVASVRAIDMLDLEVAEAGPNYFVLKSKESKKARRKRQQSAVRERLAGPVVAATAVTTADEGAEQEREVDGDALAGACGAAWWRTA